MATQAEKEQLIKVLKFTPRTYTINSWSDDALTITQWRGIAYDPDEQDIRDELDTIRLEAVEQW